MKALIGIAALVLVGMSGFSVVQDFAYYAELQEGQLQPSPDFESPAPSGPSMNATSNLDGSFSVDCKHVLYDANDNYWNLSMQARVFDPVGNQIGFSSNSAYKPALTSWAIGTDSDPEDGTYKCEVDNYAEGQYLGQSLATLTVSFFWPTSLSVSSDQYIRRNFNDYDREIHYQVHDQYQNPLQVEGLEVIESYNKTSDTCTMPGIDTAQTLTNNQGRFKDNYRMQSVPGCDLNPMCSATFNQTIRVADRVVRTNEVVYDCYGVTITPQ